MSLNYFDLNSMAAAIPGATTILEEFAPLVGFTIAIAVLSVFVSWVVGMRGQRLDQAQGNGRVAAAGAMGHGAWVQSRRAQRQTIKNNHSRYIGAAHASYTREDQGGPAYYGPAFHEDDYK